MSMEQQEARFRRRTHQLGAALMDLKAEKRLTTVEMASGLGISPNTLRKLSDGEDVHLHIHTLWAMLGVAGWNIQQT